jgi:hypothetical protein
LHPQTCFVVNGRDRHHSLRRRRWLRLKSRDASERELVDAVRARRPHVRVLFTSGYTEDIISHHGRLDPGVSLLPKAYRKPELARMIRVALARAR